jgi:uncharacterized protein (TIGR02246 family)
MTPKLTTVLLTALAGLTAAALRAQDATSTAAPAPAGVATSAGAQGDGGAAVLRKDADEFVAAFNRGDAAAVAAHWMEDGDYVDEDGHVTAGRAAIEKLYAQFFQEHAGVAMTVAIDAVRMPSPAVAIEKGRVTLDPEPEGAPGATHYTAIHVNVDGKWLMATVRDTRTQSPSNYAALEPLAWLVGSWQADGPTATAEVTCRWVANKSFLQRSFRVRIGDEVATSGEQIIGWNPLTGGIQSWIFSSDGGMAVGTWAQTEAGWTVESVGATAEGAPTHALTTMTPLGADAIAWQSTSRSIAGAALPDTDEVVLRRMPKTP